jgi:HEAT repeat protein
VPRGAEIRSRELRAAVAQALRSPDPAGAMAALERFPPRRRINPLFSFLYHGDPAVKWSAVSAIGACVAALADENLEEARKVLRRLMWNLNDESGGIGWGSPEAMGEILSRHAQLAAEYAPILLSYTLPEGNYLEPPLLQRGLLWGIGRLAERDPERVREVGSRLTDYLRSPDSGVRGAAARLAGLLGGGEAPLELRELLSDEADLEHFDGKQVIRVPVRAVAAEALARFSAAAQGGPGERMDFTKRA